MKTFNLNFDDEIINVYFERNAYANNNTLALSLITEDGEPFCDLTVNLVDSTVWGDEKTAFIDTNNCPFAEEFIAENKLGTPVGYAARSGFCTYPLYRFDLERLEE